MLTTFSMFNTRCIDHLSRFQTHAKMDGALREWPRLTEYVREHPGHPDLPFQDEPWDRRHHRSSARSSVCPLLTAQAAFDLAILMDARMTFFYGLAGTDILDTVYELNFAVAPALELYQPVHDAYLWQSQGKLERRYPQL